jgi:hypothetical protein
MLDQMERMLWGEGGGGGRLGDESEGKLADPTFEALLQVLLKRDRLNNDDSDANITGMKKLRGLLKIVGDSLK